MDIIPPEIVYKVFSYANDIKTLKSFSTDIQLHNKFKGYIKYIYDPNIEYIDTNILCKYPDVYQCYNSIKICNLSDIFAVNSHPSLAIYQLYFDYDTEYKYFMIYQFLQLHSKNNLSNKCILIPYNDIEYIFMCGDILVIDADYGSPYDKDSILTIVVMLLKTNTYKNIYLSLHWYNIIFYDAPELFDIYHYMNDKNYTLNIISEIDISDKVYEPISSSFNNIKVYKNNISKTILKNITKIMKSENTMKDMISYFSQIN
ncbi:Hypothetical protein ORPV_144 [Orpheovirus IHUMI-LCC2]|uniref:Uncharacterized protein n=1 Tax=Orpheovirus IHUMI-LCC2 TaxID=2023057 RepID=A0A2I2L3D4_9VIRU|nr:Hypothetical protein ORPV_144 [Orpheovirus IHUMI-LCC2]SNW62048.1 Hypothetical protein ORPV_144 [Orpheovirus IHUMI-LCC2]